jgi:hypothetical protein
MANSLEVTHTGNGAFRMVGKFPGHPDVDVTVSSGDFHATQLARVIRLGLTNAGRDSWASDKDEADARQSLVEMIQGLGDEFTGGGGRGPRLSWEERQTRDIIDSALEAWFEEKKGKYPKKESERAKWRTKWMANAERATKVERELAKRLADRKKSAAVSDADLEAMLIG